MDSVPSKSSENIVLPVGVTGRVVVVDSIIVIENACTRTPESEVYYIRNIVNDDPNDTTGADVHLMYKTDGTYVDIKNKNDLFYTGDKYVRNNLSTSPSTTIRTDDNISSIQGFHQSTWILDAMSEAREFF